MITTTLLVVASADIIRKRDLFLGVYVATKTAFLVARRATVTASDPFIGLENESMIIHSINYEICVVQFLQFPQFALQNCRNCGSCMELEFKIFAMRGLLE